MIRLLAIVSFPVQHYLIKRTAIIKPRSHNETIGSLFNLTILFKSAQWSIATTKKYACFANIQALLLPWSAFDTWKASAFLQIAALFWLGLCPIVGALAKTSCGRKGSAGGQEQPRYIAAGLWMWMCWCSIADALMLRRVRNVTPKSSKSDDGCDTQS